MARVNLDNVKTTDMRHAKGQFFESCQITPASGDALPDNAPPLIFWNPGGAVNIKMPTSNAARQGLTFIMVNLTANTVTLQTDGGAGFTNAIAIASTQMAIVTCTGSSTQASGWRAMTAAGTQTSP